MGAFEDRLAEGYRKAERAPLRTAQTTTPTTETGKVVMQEQPLPLSRKLRPIDPEEILAIEQEAAAQERRRLLDIHMADHDDATGWCRTCSLLTEGE